MSLCQPALQKLNLLNRIELSLFTNGRLRWATKFGCFCRGKLQNFANWLAEFGKIFCGKLWALIITSVHHLAIKSCIQVTVSVKKIEVCVCRRRVDSEDVETDGTVWQQVIDGRWSTCGSGRQTWCAQENQTFPWSDCQGTWVWLRYSIGVCFVVRVFSGEKFYCLCQANLVNGGVNVFTRFVGLSVCSYIIVTHCTWRRDNNDVIASLADCV